MQKFAAVKNYSNKFNYLNKFSRSALVKRSIDLLHYVTKSAALLGFTCYLINKSPFPEQKLAEYAFKETNVYSPLKESLK